MSELSHKRAGLLIQQGRLSPDERSSLTAHLDRCEACRDYAAAHMFLSHNLQLAAVRTRPSPELKGAILQRVHSQHRRNRIMNPLRAAAAVGLLAVVVFAWLMIRSAADQTAIAPGGAEEQGAATREEPTRIPPPTLTPLPPTEPAPAAETPAAGETEPTPVSPFNSGSLRSGQEEAYSFVSSSGEEIVYWLYLPESYDDSQAWPLIISLHGFLGFEPSLDRVREQSPTAYVGPDVEFPFIVISPRAPNGSWALYHEPMEELIAFLGESLSIDPDAQFITGLSAGGIGAWQWALAFPDRFTGLALIAGVIPIDPSDPPPENICLLKDLPIWIAHSEADTHVPIESDRAAVRALEECGSTVTQFTVYPDLDHAASARTAYGGPELYDWMLALMDEES